MVLIMLHRLSLMSLFYYILNLVVYGNRSAKACGLSRRAVRSQVASQPVSHCTWTFSCRLSGRGGDTRLARSMPTGDRVNACMNGVLRPWRDAAQAHRAQAPDMLRPAGGPRGCPW